MIQDSNTFQLYKQKVYYSVTENSNQCFYYFHIACPDFFLHTVFHATSQCFRTFFHMLSFLTCIDEHELKKHDISESFLSAVSKQFVFLFIKIINPIF